MRGKLLALLMLAAPIAAFAQLDDNTITVTASRTSNLQPDQAQMGVTVASAATATLDDVVAALNGSGITAANLTSTSYVQVVGTPPLTSQWYFTIAVPIAQVNALIATLGKIQQRLAVPGTAMAVSYYLQGLQVSAQLQAANPCAFTSLVSDAQRQAQTLAAAAGVSVGPIVAISDGSGTGSAVAVLAVRQGDFSSLLGGAIVTAGLAYQWYAPATAPACTMTVQFQLLH